MRHHLRAVVAALGAGAALGLCAGAGCSTQQCKDMKGSGSAFASLLCGAEGTPAPEPVVPALSLCQPREVMPVFFSLIDNNDPSLAGLRGAVGDLGRPVCLVPKDRTCKSDDNCPVGHCENGLCPCQTSHSPLTDVMGVALRAMATIADDKPEIPGAPLPGCLSAAQAESLPIGQRNRMCEIRRTLDVLLQQNGGSNLVNDPQIQKVLLSLLDYVQGKNTADGKTHYDLMTPLGRMAGADTAECKPAALWTLLDDMFGYLTPQTATAQLGAMQVLLADPNTKALLGSLTASGGADARDSMILLVHSLSPGIVAAHSIDDVLGPNGSVTQLVNQFVYSSSSYPQSFKDEVKAVLGNADAMLSSAAYPMFPSLQELVACMGSAEIRCADPAHCTNHDDELIGALYDILSKPESAGGVDLATLVGALKTLTTLDQTGQTGRTLRMVVRSIEGCPTDSDACTLDPNGTYEARDAIGALAADSLTAEEGQKLLPAVEVLIEKQVVTEMFSLLQDLLYTCKPPPAP